MIYLDLEGKAPIFANASKVTHALFKDISRREFPR